MKFRHTVVPVSAGDLTYTQGIKVTDNRYKAIETSNERPQSQ
jgi:hypothetical protein